ncbi:hypothetical protein F4604DRAFT_1922872 [Suillus subluteus]|nr:hypothetical protein F4604DRAFT_1922872 [Suillus subluteus]
MSDRQPCLSQRSQGVQGHLAFDVSDVANIFKYAGSRLLAIRTMLESRWGVISAEGRIILNEYLNWEAESFLLPWVSVCESARTDPPVSQNLHIFLGIFRTGTVRQVAKEMYLAFMNIPAEPSSAWVTSHVVQSYKFAWWNTAFDVTPNKDFIGVHPSSHELWDILFDHFGQLGNTWHAGRRSSNCCTKQVENKIHLVELSPQRMGM